MTKSRALLLWAVLVGVTVLSSCGPGATPAEKPAASPTARPSQIPQPTMVKPTAKVGSALEWYPIAEKEAIAWQSDAVLHSAVGGNIAMDGSSLPCDGRAELWTYSFVSTATQKKLTVSVQAGALSSKSESALTRLDGQPLTQEDLEFYSHLYSSSDWKVDSTQAAQVSNPLFKAQYNVEPRLISYVMFNTKYLDVLNNKAINWMYWVISYDPEKYPFQVTMDARTGEVKERP